MKNYSLRQLELKKYRDHLELTVEERTADLSKKHEELINTHNHLVQQEKMASVGLLAAGVAHEINNPMGFIGSNLSILDKYVGKLVEFIGVQDENLQEFVPETGGLSKVKKIRKNLKIDYIIRDIKDLVNESLEGVDRVKEIVKNLKNFSRVDEVDCKASNLNEGLESTIKVIWNELKYKAQIIKEYGEIPLIECYPQQINQVFMNLMVNSAHAIDDNGEIKVKTWQEKSNVFISIADTGRGIETENIEKIFDPFFTTKEVDKGTGLGLSISYEIIQKHGGEMTVASEIGKGTTFTIKLPVKSTGLVTNSVDNFLN